MTEYKCAKCGAVNGIEADTTVCPWCDNSTSPMVTYDWSSMSGLYGSSTTARSKPYDPHQAQLDLYKKLAEKQNIRTQPTPPRIMAGDMDGFLLCSKCTLWITRGEWSAHKEGCGKK